MPAVEVADPGASYNPDAEQHQDLIGEALVQEKRRLSTERRMKHMTWNQQRVLRGKDPTEMLAAQEVGEGEEGVALLEDAGDGKTSAAAAGDEDEEDGSRAVQNNKMTRAQRNKQARVREQERQLRERRQAKRRRQQENRVEAIVGEVKHISAEREAKAAKREEQVGDDGHTPARAGASPAAQWSFVALRVWCTVGRGRKIVCVGGSVLGEPSSRRGLGPRNTKRRCWRWTCRLPRSSRAACAAPR